MILTTGNNHIQIVITDRQSPAYTIHQKLPPVSRLVCCVYEYFNKLKRSWDDLEARPGYEFFRKWVFCTRELDVGRFSSGSVHLLGSMKGEVAIHSDSTAVCWCTHEDVFQPITAYYDSNRLPASTLQWVTLWSKGCEFSFEAPFCACVKALQGCEFRR